MSNLESQSPANIDRGSHKTPDFVRNREALLAKMEATSYSDEDEYDDPFNPKEVVKHKAVTPLLHAAPENLHVDNFTLDFIRKNPKDAEDVIRWYSSIKNNKVSKNKLLLGIAGFPVKVKVNPILIKNDDNYLTVFVRSDNSLEISIPIASEVILDGEIDGDVFTNKSGMFLGEVNFDKNFLFKILIFVVK